MKALVLVGLLAGCYREYGPGPVAPMGNIQPDPVAVSGPPGGSADPGYGYDQPSSQDPTMPGYNAGYPEGYPVATEESGPQDPYATAPAEGGGDAMGTVNDAQIDATLAPYGEWVESEEFGRVWRPYATVVGAGFTPYETCGSWVWTDYGWTYTCDFDWGWLPFHYGQWDWFDNSWCWIPDYTWGPGWVDWRYGNNYVGWRPTRPHRPGRDIVRDHRGSRAYGQVIWNPNRKRESDWRFVPQSTLGKHTRGNLVAATTALPVTKQVSRVPVRGSTTVAAATLLGRNQGRRFDASRTNPYTNGSPSRPAYRGQRDPYPRTFDNRTYPRGVQQPRYDNRGAYQPSRGTYQPSRGTYQPSPTERPSRTYEPSRGTYQPSRGTYQPPTRTQPSRTYSPPSSSSSSSGSSRPSSSSSSRPSSSSSSSSRGSSSSSSSHGSSSSSSSSSRGSSSSSSHSSSSSSSGSRGRK